MADLSANYISNSARCPIRCLELTRKKSLFCRTLGERQFIKLPRKIFVRRTVPLKVQDATTTISIFKDKEKMKN